MKKPKVKPTKEWAVTKGIGIMDDHGEFTGGWIHAVFKTKKQAEQFHKNVLAHGKIIKVLITPIK